EVVGGSGAHDTRSPQVFVIMVVVEATENENPRDSGRTAVQTECDLGLSWPGDHTGATGFGALVLVCRIRADRGRRRRECLPDARSRAVYQGSAPSRTPTWPDHRAPRSSHRLPGHPEHP